MEYETLTLAEVKDLIKGIPPLRDDFDNNSDLKQTTPTQSAPKLVKQLVLRHNNFFKNFLYQENLNKRRHA